MNRDPWGLGYKIVTRKLGAFAREGPQDAERIQNIVDALFPSHPVREIERETIEPAEIPIFSEDELILAADSLQTEKAPGPDGIPAEVLKAVARTHPQLLLCMFNICLRAGVFCSRWKRARLVLISKGKGDANSPASYRPLCMLDTAGKVLEKLIKPRLLQAIKDSGDLSDRQYGFRKGRSTVDAINTLVASARIT